MKKDIEYINKQISGLNVYINNLISEQSVPKDEEQNALADAIESGEGFEEIFSEEEQENIDEWTEEGRDLAEYVIVAGPYAGTKLGPTVAKAYRVVKKVSSFKNPFKKKVSPDICSCYALSRKYTSGSGECENKKQCHKTFKKNFKADIATLTGYDQKLAMDYFNSCHRKYSLQGMWKKSVRDSAENKRNCNEFQDFLGSISNITSELTSMLSQYFRIKNQKELSKKRGKGDSIAERLSTYSKITIQFSQDTTPVNTAPPNDNCTSYSTNFISGAGNALTFEVMSSSSLNEGKTVILKNGSKYCYMTFDSDIRGKDNGGNVTWANYSDNMKKMCGAYPWKGKIIELKT
jgi:hypothetical protein